jgi:anti-sigma factor RsiW
MSRQDSGHQECWELLPWYVNGTLTGRDLDVVTGHLAGCAACAAEVTRCRDLAVTVVSGSSGMEPARSAERLARVLARIDAIETAGAGSPRWRERLRERLDGLRELFQSTPAPARWALAVQGALVVLLVAVSAWQLALSANSPYHTLASGTQEPGRGQAKIHVVFNENTTEREIRTLLEQLGGRIVDGPSTVGAYTVQVPVPAAAADRVASVLGSLRADPKVRLAEPIRSR